MTDIPTNEPMSVTAGDTVTWKRSLSDYLASAGWVLSYTLVNSAGKITITSTADGDDHLVSVLAATTAAWTAGEYSWQAYVTKGAERYQVDYGALEILPDFAQQTTHDGRSHVKTVLDSIEAVIEGRATKDQESYSINGRSLARTSVEQLLVFRDRYKAEYAREVRAERIRNGLGHSGRILTRF